MTQSPKSPVLEACPNPTAIHGHQSTMIRQETTLFAVECLICGCRSGWWEAEAEAIAAWNTRATSPRQRALEEVAKAAKYVSAMDDGPSDPTWHGLYRSALDRLKAALDALKGASQ